MAFENFESIVSLLCIIVGLMFSIFRYIETPKRWYGFLVIFFLSDFLSEYYWTIYLIVMHSYPDVSMFVAYLGWNIGYLVLFLAVFTMRSEESRRYFHPVMLLPVLANVPQFVLYISFGGVLNNIWEVGVTTLTMIFCLQEILFHLKNRGKTGRFPLFQLFVLIYLALGYIMWTASCFTLKTALADPYFYCSILSSLFCLSLPIAAGRSYGEGYSEDAKSASELRLQALVQSMTVLVILLVGAGGFFYAVRLKRNLPDGGGRHIVTYLFAISMLLIALMLLMLLLLNSRYHRLMDKIQRRTGGIRSRRFFLFTISMTFALMVFTAVYNGVVLYRASVLSVYEDGEAEIKSVATDLENYLTTAQTTLRVVADGVDLMVENGRTTDEVRGFIMDQTARQAAEFDDNFTGIYAYIDGEYLDGLGWVPPEGYDPASRDWYRMAVSAGGEVVMVPPYLDVQTGSVIITIARSISEKDVVALDVIVSHVQEIAQNMDIAGKGYGMVVDSDGFIVAHEEAELNGRNVIDVYGQEFLGSILSDRDGRTTASVEGESFTLFVAPVMDQWYSVIAVEETKLLEESNTSLNVNIMVSLITFSLISFFYYTGYKNEKLSGKRVEEMNIQVVKALATAIDAKDNYTNGHSSRVAEYSRMIAARSGFSKAYQDEIYLIGLLHDVGKIGIPDDVINKAGRLTDDEFALVRNHPVIGERILSSIKDRPGLAIGARWHHERYDGKGYPDGLTGDAIPEEARIIAVADAYDAMTSRRSYRDIMPQKDVRSEIENGIGTQFDPRFARVMIRMIDLDREYMMRERSRD